MTVTVRGGYELRNGVLVPREHEPDSVLPAFPERCECGAAWSELGADICHTNVGARAGCSDDRDHDDNCTTRSIWCAAGHRFAIGIRRTCKHCDWKGKEQCCGPFRYLDAWPDLPVRERAADRR